MSKNNKVLITGGLGFIGSHLAKIIIKKKIASKCILLDSFSGFINPTKDNFIDFECFEPFKRLTIWAYGGAGPCCGFPGIKYNVGNFANRSIFDIWHGKEIKRIRKMMITKDYELPAEITNGAKNAPIIPIVAKLAESCLKASKE